jgi:nitric oxide reductase subunit B
MPPVYPKPDPGRRVEKTNLLVSKKWIQAVAVVVLFGFFVLGFLAYRTYSDEAPIPRRVVEANGDVLYTGADIVAGQQIFLRNGLMEYGSIFGHGAYLGPDFTADYLRRAATAVAKSYEGVSTPEQARIQTALDFKTNRYDAASETLVFTAGQSAAHRDLVAYYGKFFSEPGTQFGLRPRAIDDPTEIRQLVAFFSWSAWVSAALRPHHNYSYTNNWPSEPLVNNTVTADMIVWSMLSLAALLGGVGALFFAFGRWNFLGWHGREHHTLSFRPPNDVVLTPAQRVTGWFFLTMALLFLIQTLAGAACQHYRADITSFFGIDLAPLLPFNVARTWHLQLAIFWVSTSYLAAGIFLAPMLSGREPKIQKWLAIGLLGALAIVVFGSLFGEFAGIHGWIQKYWSWFGNQGFEYLDLDRFWQILLTAGLGIWVVMLFIGLRGRLRIEHKGNFSRRVGTLQNNTCAL